MEPSQTPPNPSDYFTPYPTPNIDTMYRHIYFTTYQPMILSGLPIDEELMGQFDGLDLSYPLTDDELFIMEDYNQFAARMEVALPTFYGEDGTQVYKKEDFLVTKDNIDEYGYPNVQIMTQLYAYLWNFKPELFNPEQNYWWADTPENVLWYCADYWRILTAIEVQQKEHEKALKEYEKELKKWEEEQARLAQDEEESTDSMFKAAFNQKQAKIKKGAPPQMPSAFSKVP